MPSIHYARYGGGITMHIMVLLNDNYRLRSAIWV